MEITKNPLSLLRLYKRSRAAYKHATDQAVPGLEFHRFGKRLGHRLLARRGIPRGLDYILNPVSITRYFEFPFALSCLSERPEYCLDVSSPRLFSLYVADKNPSAHVSMINPDPNDASYTAQIVSKLGINNVAVQNQGVDMLVDRERAYDCIWAISVIEHISGDYDDRETVKWMYDSLKDAGRLIVTVPVDRRFRCEYRDEDFYGTQPDQIGGQHFFQRVYDKAAVWERLLLPIGEEPSVVRWFGETSPGRYREYEKRWLAEGLNCTVEDPKEIADHYREFSSWEGMPGEGVCALMIEKHEPAGS